MSETLVVVSDKIVDTSSDNFLAEIERELKSRELKKSNYKSSYCPLAETEQCGLLYFSEVQCKFCHTAKRFIKEYPSSEAFLERSEESIEEQEKQIRKEMAEEFHYGFIINQVITKFLTDVIETATKTSNGGPILPKDMNKAMLVQMYILAGMRTDIEHGEKSYEKIINGLKEMISKKITQEDSDLPN